MRCKHYGPSASDETVAKCPLCKALATGKMTKNALVVLQAMPVKAPPGRVCPECDEESEELVSCNGRHICEPCARKEDGDE